jgi:hypothetical protein
MTEAQIPPVGGGGNGDDGPPPSNKGGGDDEEPPGNRNDLSRLGKTTQESVEIKLKNYPLNPDHRQPSGAHTGKATWFKDNLGFTQDNMSLLAKQLEFDPQTAVVEKRQFMEIDIDR